MPRYEYKLVPAPEKARKHKGLKGVANFAATLEDVMNAMGAEGWTYLRADILPEEVRAGLTSKATVYRTLLVFQRELPDDRPPAQAPVTTHAAPPPEPVQADEDEDQDDHDSPPALANLFVLQDVDGDDRDDGGKGPGDRRP